MEKPPQEPGDWMQQAMEDLPPAADSTFRVRNPDSLLPGAQKPPPEPLPAPSRLAGWPRWAAYAALALGVVNLCSWAIPLFGIPLAVISIGLGVLGLKSAARRMAVVGLVLSGIGLLCGILNVTVGVFSY